MPRVNYVKEEIKDEFPAIPAGLYSAIIYETEYKDNSKGTGMVLVLKYQIIDGPLNGRKINQFINAKHENKVAENIGKKQMNFVLDALDLNELTDTEILHNKPLLIDIKMTGDEDFPNKINKVLPIKESNTSKVETSPSVTTQGSENGNPKPVWAK